MTLSKSSTLKPLRWLHLSDLHLGTPGKNEWWVTAQHFEKGIKGHISKFEKPDVIFITGDIAFSASPEQYEKFDSFINELDKLLGNKPPIICVPGNHDVCRPDLEKPINYGYKILSDYTRDGEDVTNFKKELWEKEDTSFLKPLFESYENFLNRTIIPRLEEQNGITVKKSPTFPGDIRVDIEIADRVPLTVVGLNSAWVQCSAGDYDGKLAVETGQLRALLESDEGQNQPLNPNSLLLMHHPLAWLHEDNQEAFKAEIYTSTRFDVCLHGHMHKAKHISIKNSGVTRKFFQAPSLFGLEHWGTKKETREIGYTWGQLDADGRIRVWPYRLAKSLDRFVFDTDWIDAKEEEGLEIQPAKETNHNSQEATSPAEDNISNEPHSANPYKYLKYYDISDGDTLYGRDELTKTIVEEVKQLFSIENTPCFIGLTGRSGCGKSSLLRAGILSQLNKEEHPDRYLTIAFRPTDFHDQNGNPQNIIQRIIGEISQRDNLELSATALHEVEQASATGRAKKAIDKIIEALTKQQSETPLRLIIGLDQFEEILDDLAKDDRKDNWEDLVKFIELALKSKLIGFIYTLETSRQKIVRNTRIKHLSKKTYDVDGYSKAFLRDIITKPFQEKGYRLDEDEIVTPLLENTNELRNEAKGDKADSLLPLLALTLAHLFDVVKAKAPQPVANKTLKQAQETIGLDIIKDKKLLDVRNAIQMETKNAWDDNTDNLGHFLRPLLRISDLTTDRFVLRKVPIHPYSDDRKQAENFINRRLLVREDGRIRLVHEAVIRFWPAAAEWFEKEKELLRTEVRFREKARQWSKKKLNPAGSIDDAADILSSYRRSWSISNEGEIDQKDQQLRDFCLAVFAKSKKPTKKINSSVKTGSCHVHLAASYDQVDLLRKFKKLDPKSLNHPRLDHRTPLGEAVWGAPNAVHYLLEEGASATKKDEKGWRPLCASIIMGNTEIFHDLIDHYKKSELEDWPDGSTALHLLGANNLSKDNNKNHLVIAHYLVEKRKLNPDETDDWRNTPLHRIAGQGNTLIFDYFAQISNVNAVNNNGWTALHLAASQGHIDIINLLLENDKFTQKSREALTNIDRLAPGANALHIAVLKKHPEAVRLLLDNGIDPNIRAASEGRTALHMAANLFADSVDNVHGEKKEHSREIVRFLLEHPDIDVNVRDKNNQTPLSLAGKDKDVLRMLLANQKLDPNTPASPNGPAPMLICAEIQDWKLTDQLLARSSDAAHNTKTDKGDSLLHLLVENKAPKSLIGKALEASPTLSIANNEGRTPLMVAIINDDDNDNLELIQLLLSYEKGVRSPSDKLGSALLVAIENNASQAILDELISDDTIQQLISTNTRGWSVQHAACAKASESTLNWLIDHDSFGAGLTDIRDQWGRRPIDLAPPGLQDKWGGTPEDPSTPKSWDSDLKWKPLDEKVVAELTRCESPVDDKYEITADTKVEWAELPFYEKGSVNIVRLTDTEKHWPDNLRLYFILHSTEEDFDIIRLNGTSPPIHQLNSKNLLTLNNENVLDYLRFFCFFVRGDEGAFLIAEDVAQKEMPHDLSPKNISDLNPCLRPSKLFRQKDGKYRASAIVYYSSALFFADFTIIHNSGIVEMEDDLLVLEDLPKNENIPIS